MKKHISIISLAALTLFSCGGGNQNQNTGTSGTAGKDSANTVSTTPESDDMPFSMEDVLIALGGDLNLDSHDFVEDENLAYFQRGERIYSEHFVKAFPIDGNAYKVFESFTCVAGMNEADYEGESHFIKEYVYKNGEAKEVDLQAELKPYASKYATDFSKDILKILNGTEIIKKFQWDGTKFVEQEDLFAYEILKQIITDQKEFDRICNDLETKGMNGEDCGPLKRENWGTTRWLRFIYHEDDMYPEEGYLDCFLINSGGYFALFRTMSCGDYEHWTYTPYIYKNGRLYDGKRMMPVPGINDYYSNADKFPKDAADVLSAAMEAPEYCLEYCDDIITLYVSFNPWELDERGGVLPAPLKGFQRKENGGFPGLSYHWTGDGFSCADKPYKEDLQYFEVVPTEWKSAVAYQAAQKLGLNFPNQELKHPNHFRMWKDEFDPPSFNVVCFPYSAGGHLVLCGEGPGCLQDYKSYIFKDGEIKEIDFRLPVCPLTELLDDSKCQGLDEEIKKLEQIYAEKPSLVVLYVFNIERQEIEPQYSLDWDAELPNDTREKLVRLAKYDNLPKYKWDGEKFVKL